MIWDYAKRNNSRVLLYLKKNGLNRLEKVVRNLPFKNNNNNIY